MSNESIIVLIAACCGVFGLAAWIGLLAAPAWQSYSRLWERIAATVLSLYSLAAFMLVAVAAGAAVVWFWDRLSP